jgi:hypothetical protein
VSQNPTAIQVADGMRRDQVEPTQHILVGGVAHGEALATSCSSRAANCSRHSCDAIAGRCLAVREREGWRVGRDTGVARWCHCRPRGAVKKFPFIFLNRRRNIHGSCYSKKKSTQLALQKKCTMLTNQAMTRSNHKGLTLQGA